MIGISHVAGAPEGMLQSCVRCGLALLDYRRVVVVAESFRPEFWTAGMQVAVGSDSRAMTTPEGGEVVCGGGADE